MELPDRIAIGTTFLVQRPLAAVLAALESALEAQEVDVKRDGPYVFLCRALREHQPVLLDVGIFNKSGTIMVSMRRCAGDRHQAVLLANEIGASAGLRGPVIGAPKHSRMPDIAGCAALLCKDKIQWLCSAANMGAALQTAQGRALMERVASMACDRADPLLRLAALSAAVSIVRAGGDPRVFKAAAREGLGDPDRLARIQADHLLTFL